MEGPARYTKERSCLCKRFAFPEKRCVFEQNYALHQRRCLALHFCSRAVAGAEMGLLGGGGDVCNPFLRILGLSENEAASNPGKEMSTVKNEMKTQCQATGGTWGLS